MDLSDFIVIDSLISGPPELRNNRLTMPYTVVRDGRTFSFPLIYRYEHDVFDPDDPGDQNLASLIGAQVALNYGLFCRTIRFQGRFSSGDRSFLVNMMENTSREILVKKLLEHNPFIKPEYRNIQAIRQKTYTQARIEFEREYTDGPAQELSWRISNSRSAILSSGGKDSLLSYGLMNEIGGELFPIFINESGRHWYTALNAYRYFRSKVPDTQRVWTNCDRLFNWMLRQLSFVREDFARLRSDDYPIRLWTVAVFLFGALPLLKKLRIAQLIIGDEYDTSRRLTHSGIPHYDGLYDQSVFFDNTLSRYFMRKGWQLHQFSVLRHLSEFLIQKILQQRYPYLQSHQVSCHAAHVAGGRVFPCGRCEKCRRIVGMLVALDADPKNCGYSETQVRDALRALVRLPVHQESAGAEHMLKILSEKKINDPELKFGRVHRFHPEIEKIRIHDSVAPVETIPLAFRRDLFRIYGEHSAGCVRRRGRIWVEFDPLTDRRFHQVNIFEGKPMGRQNKTGSGTGNYILGHLSWPEAEKRFKEVDVALLPVGATEQHGPHLPLDTDAFDAAYLAERVAEACSDPKPLVLPLIPYGVSYHHEDFSGTISITNETLSRMVYEIGMSVAKNGITKLVIVNGHGGNAPSLQFAAQMINRDAHIFTCVDTGETSDVDLAELGETPNDVHAGEMETSTALAVRPDLVKLNKMEKYVPEFSNRYLNFSARRSIEWYARTSRISKSGVLGDPSLATREKGEAMWQVMIRNLTDFVENLKNLSLEEIYERRY